MKGMPSHFIPPFGMYQYPGGNTTNYHILDKAIYEQYYNNYISRILLAGVNNHACDWYCKTYGQDFPTSFVTDNKGTSVTLSSGDSCRWLVIIHSGNAMYLHLVCYIVVNRDCIWLFRDRSARLTIDISKPGEGISGVTIPLNHTIGTVAGDMSSL